MRGLLIGDVAKSTGVTAATIRYYESIGLLAPPPRSLAGYRRYSQSAVKELEFIKRARGLGFSLEEILEILKLSRTGQAPCSHVLDLAQRHLAAVEERIAALARFREELAAEISRWKGLEQSVCEGVCQMIAGAHELRAPGGLQADRPAPRPTKAAR